MKKVITYGTFDILHYGHIEYLRKAKEMGDYLIVGLSTDEFTHKKGKEPYYPFDVRKKMLEAIKYVDEVIVQNSFEQKKDDVLQYNIDVLISGEEYQGKYDYLKEYCEVYYLPRTKGVSTTKIKNDINKHIV